MAATFQPPKGTRDAYPDEFLRRRYIVESWRRTALRHGFDEIDGPTFEHASLYTVKSGQGILNEMFQVFSGKDDAQREAAGRGEAPFALRPEFTPTLARMYAAKAKQLPSPCKWFCTPNFFRAERPQRGRLREFLQWNIDVLGDETPAADVEILGAIAGLFGTLGVPSSSVTFKLSNRDVIAELMSRTGVGADGVGEAMQLLDRRDRLTPEQFDEGAAAIAWRHGAFEDLAEALGNGLNALIAALEQGDASRAAIEQDPSPALANLAQTIRRLSAAEIIRWCAFDPTIVRGLAYYTGTVFEVIAEGERAVAGGGRYDKLIELFGGPPTPACGFGMGDVVLTNLLEDHSLMPSGKDLLVALDQPVRTRPDVFIVPSPELDDETAESLITRTLATLRRGTLNGDAEREPWHPDRYAIAPLHARRSYKSTRKVQKLIADASAQHARFALIIEDERRATVQDLDSGQRTEGVALGDAGAVVTRAL